MPEELPADMSKQGPAQQWIPLSGPGSRLPTIEDGDLWGRVLGMATDGYAYSMSVRSLCERKDVTHFLPMPTPPLPKPVDLSQEDKDQQKANQIIRTNSSGRLGADIIAGIQYGRADGRRELAAECLALVGSYPHLIDSRLHKLLTEAAKP